mgnify:CR=1 FL=1
METTLRDTISALVDKSEAGEPLDSPSTEPSSTEPVETSTETEEQKAGRTAGRSRDEKGRLLPGKVEIQAPEVQRPPRPSSWKKDYWDDWEKLDPRIAEYVNQREQEYAKGVSTYKQEWEQAKPLLEAIAPYIPDLQKVGVSPAQAISRLASTHKELINANPQQRLMLFSRLAQEYQVPIQALADPNIAQAYINQPQQQPQIPVAKQVQEALSEMFSKQSVKDFGEAKDTSGNPRYPHFDTVRNAMAQLLETGLANDLEDAYGKAIRLQDDLWKSEQETQRKAEEAERLRVKQQAVHTAKSNAISPRSATPATVGAGAKKGLRDQLSDAFDSVTSGRV